MEAKKEVSLKRSYVAGALLLTAVVSSAVSGYYGAMFAKSSPGAVMYDESQLEVVLTELLAAVKDDCSTDISYLEDEVNEIEYQFGLLEARVVSVEEDEAEVAKFSEFEMAGPANPTKSYKLPGVFVEFRGRTLFSFSLDLRVNAKQSVFGAILQIGDQHNSRSPFFGKHTNSRGLHFVQRLEGTINSAGFPVIGMNPALEKTPPMGEYFKIDFIAGVQRLEIKYNGEVVYQIDKEVLPLIGRQDVWFSDPWHTAGTVTVKNWKFKID